LEDLRRGRKYYVSPAALPSGLPDWFIERDKNGDGQLTLDEFAPDGSAAERRRFHELDKNGDGVITPDEVVGPAKTSLAKEKPETKTSAEKKQPSSSAKPSGGSPSH
jgi:Ca2+-binding EF-hand superfamily protein